MTFNGGRKEGATAAALRDSLPFWKDYFTYSRSEVANEAARTV